MADGLLFTCRDLGITIGSWSWPAAANLCVASTPTHALGSPYEILNYPPANLLPPYSSFPAMVGVAIYNSGLTLNPTSSSPVYSSIIIGDRFGRGTLNNIFDNLHDGIYAENSNVSSYNNVFQNTRFAGFLIGCGIKALNNNQHPGNYNTFLEMESALDPASNFNRFFDCQRAVELRDLFDFNCRYAQFRSTKNLQSSSSFAGAIGIWIYSNKFKNYRILDNKFNNITSSIICYATYGSVNFGSPIYGQVWGSFNIANNFFSPALSSASSPNSGYCHHAIIFENALYVRNPVLGQGFVNLAPLNGLRIRQNELDRVFRGIWLRNLSNSIFNKIVDNNTVTISQDIYSLHPLQWGVLSENNYATIVNSNTITGFTSQATLPVYGINCSQSLNTTFRCNLLSNVPVDFQFAGLNSGIMWRDNLMNTSGRGLQLASNGILGQQGVANSPNDNLWQGSWTLPDAHTFTENSNAVTSPLYHRTTSGFVPIINDRNSSAATAYTATGAFTSLFPAHNGSPMAPCMPAVQPPYGTSGSPTNVSLLNAIINNNVPYAGNFTAETHEINTTLIYRDIAQDTALQNCQSLNSFYTANQSSGMGVYAEVELLLAEGDFQGASNYLNSMTPSTNIESNYDLFYSLYIKFRDPSYTFDSTDQVNLKILAYKCPFTDGAVVYSARTLYNIVNDVSEIIDDSRCDQQQDFMESYDHGMVERKGRLNAAGLDGELPLFDFAVFPSPSSGEIVIINPFPQEKLNVRILDLEGRQLFNEVKAANNHELKLDLKLANGLYFVVLRIESEQPRTFKVVIQR